MNFFRFLGARSRNAYMTNWFAGLLYGIAASMGAYLMAWKNFDEAGDRFKVDNNGDYFDFIIVGAGSAGAVLANRLSKNYTVLLLEAGGEPHPFQLIPAFSTFMINYKANDWRYFSVPQRDGFFAQNYQESLLSAGLGLGGTSEINFLMHNRGSPKDYDNWAKVLKDDQYTYENLLPYFKKQEHYIEKNPRENLGDYHGTYGEMDIRVPDFTGLGNVYLQAANESGYNITDLNANFTEGSQNEFNESFDYVYQPMKKGERISTYTGFIKPIKYRQTLTIRKYSHVTGVLFKKTNNTDEMKEAVGVEYMRHGVKRVAMAFREVILSAGAIGSPRILMQSGVGPKEHLESLGIEVLRDLPVGKNLQDHTAVYLGPFFIDKGYTLNVDRDLTFPAFLDFMTRGTGPFTTSGTNAQGFVASPEAVKANEADWPDMQLILASISMCKECAKLLARAFNFKQDVLVPYLEHAKNKESFIQLVSNGRPHARGEILLKSSNPMMRPLINPKYLDNEHDIKVMVHGIKKALELVENSTAFQRINARFTNESFPGCHLEEFRSDEYWECFVRQYTVSLHHLVGSCSMASSEKDGVVDTSFRVFGTKRLRVVDASVMPVIPVGNTNWPTIMLGEKAADTMLKFWNHADESQKPPNENSTTLEIQDKSQVVENLIEYTLK